MGKTFWASALEQWDTRSEIARKFLGNRSAVLRNVEVAFGFVDSEGNKGISSDAIRKFGDIDPQVFWRGVITKIISNKILDRKVCLKEAVYLANSDPDACREVLRTADRQLTNQGHRTLILFDQLDLLPGNWPEIQHLTKGLLRIALAMKSYSNIRVKIFMRSDQEADDELFNFPDASKIRGERATLGWNSRNLYGLLYYTLWQNSRSRSEIQNYCRYCEVFDLKPHREYGIPLPLAIDEKAQGTVFDLIAGTMMGAGSKRGRPYTWIPTHLADGRLEISPRSFLTAIRVAADQLPKSPELVFDYLGIQAGVKDASRNRLIELQQDYPWIKDALKPLHSLTVPILKSVVYARWIDNDTFSSILRRHKDSKAPVELVLADGWPERQQAAALVDALIHIGVFEARGADRINVPDIFRIESGMKRMGGITPQQRRRI